MAAKKGTTPKKKSLMEHDPLEWVDEETDIEEPTILRVLQEEESCEVCRISLAESERIDGVSALQQKLLNAVKSSSSVVVDASAVNAIDASALQLLVVCFQEAVESGCVVSIGSPSEKFIEAAGLLGLSELFEL